MNEQTFNKLVQFDNLEKLGDGLYQIPIAILRDSEVFDGHFPDQPVLPGVVMIAIISRAVELALEMDLKMESARNFKFLKIVDPDLIESAMIDLNIITKEEGWRVKGQIKFQDEIYFKADAFYKRK
jgi:3-hydroxyacyl-[acyl-carrier-protein] dehydratase